MTNTVLGLVRHGQTDWNAQLRLQGSSDIPLNETGIAQAKSAAVKFNISDWDVIAASPLSRAKDTAQEIAEILGLRVVIIPELIERSFGEAEGLSHTEWRTRFESKEPIPGLESMEELEARSNRLLEIIANEYDGLRVLGVSHGSLIRTLVKIASQGELPLSNDRLENLSLNRLSHQDGQWSVSHYSPISLAD
ncbi:MAG: phosphoglycerate mutase family protein [Acidobacteria bacterium]|nr:phosphoglycerate mutase family protein [Acidobacteriota bacterium]